MAETILGKVCPTPKGVYNANTKYEKLDIIQHDGNGYMVLKECTGVLPSEGEYYMLLAGKGSDGTNGTDGASGTNGADGKSAYQAAVEAGYEGTEVEFATLMNSIADKQDKIIGTIGQVVGFDSMGLPHAAHWWSNRNLLINSDFRKPVNQNGKTEYSTSAYTIDRWCMDTNGGKCKLHVMDGFIRGEKVANSDSGSSAQAIFTPVDDVQGIAGKTVTFSMLRRGTGVSQLAFVRTGTVDDDGVISYKGNLQPSEDWVLDSYTTVIPADIVKLSIFAYFDTNPNTTGHTDFQAMKLELGTEQTLAHQDEDGNWVINDPINYALQYILCNLYSHNNVTGNWIGSQHSNPNLLDNWYLVDPIDQQNGYIVPAGTSYYQLSVSNAPVAGTLTAPIKVKRFSGTNAPIFEIDGTEYYSAIGSEVRGYIGAGYGIDRWKCEKDNGYVTINDGFITFHWDRATTSEHAALVQLIEAYTVYPGRPHTISILASGEGSLRLRGVDSDEARSITLTETPTLYCCTFASLHLDEIGRGKLRIIAEGNNSLSGHINIYAAKLELGHIQTLARQNAGDNWVLNDPPPDRTLELLKCQRHFMAINLHTGRDISTTISNTLGKAIFSIPISVTMRLKSAPCTTVGNVRVHDTNGKFENKILSTTAILMNHVASVVVEDLEPNTVYSLDAPISDVECKIFINCGM